MDHENDLLQQEQSIADMEENCPPLNEQAEEVIPETAQVAEGALHGDSVSETEFGPEQPENSDPWVPMEYEISCNRETVGEERNSCQPEIHCEYPHAVSQPVDPRYVPLDRSKISTPPNPYGAYRTYGPKGNGALNGNQGPNRTYLPYGKDEFNRNDPQEPGNNPQPKPFVPISAASLREPKEKKNFKTVISLVLGILAMGVLNYFPLIALIIGAAAVCTGFFGLRKGTHSTGSMICGLIGLALGIISMILSVTMLVMLLSLYIQVANL